MRPGFAAAAREDRERLVVSLSYRGSQVMRADCQDRERLTMALLHVVHARYVPAAVGGHGAAWLDPQGLAVAGGLVQAAPVGRPVEALRWPRVVDGHPAAEVDFRVSHAVAC